MSALYGEFIASRLRAGTFGRAVTPKAGCSGEITCTTKRSAPYDWAKGAAYRLRLGISSTSPLARIAMPPALKNTSV